MAHFPLSLEKRQAVLRDGASLFALYQALHDSFNDRPMKNWNWDNAPDYLQQLAALDDLCNLIFAGIAHLPDDETILQYERQISDLRAKIIVPRIIRHMQKA